MKNRKDAGRSRCRKINNNRNSHIYLFGSKQNNTIMGYTIPHPNYNYVCSADHSHVYYGYKYYKGQKCPHDKCSGYLIPISKVNKAGVNIILK